jgi:hypothetical protein
MRAMPFLAGVLLSSALTASGCGPLLFDRADAPIESGSLSSDARGALADLWPKWQPATLDPQVRNCAAGRNDPPLRLEFDADGDGAMDLALAVQTGEGTRLAVILNRALDTVVHDLDSLGGPAANGFLGVAPRGSRFTNPATKLDDYFGNPTLTATRCGEPVTAYRWTGVGFEKVVLGT